MAVSIADLVEDQRRRFGKVEGRLGYIRPEKHYRNALRLAQVEVAQDIAVAVDMKIDASFSIRLDARLSPVVDAKCKQDRH